METVEVQIKEPDNYHPSMLFPTEGAVPAAQLGQDLPDGARLLVVRGAQAVGTRRTGTLGGLQEHSVSQAPEIFPKHSLESLYLRASRSRKSAAKTPDTLPKLARKLCSCHVPAQQGHPILATQSTLP